MKYLKTLANMSMCGVPVWILVIALAARMTRMTHDLWNDESFNWFVSKDGISVAIGRIHTDFFPPLYNATLALWLRVGPITEISVRLPSILYGLITVVLAYRFTALVSNCRSGVLAGCFVALSPLMALWSQVARPFALDTCFVMGITYVGLLCAIRSVARERIDLASLTSIMVLILGAVYTNHGSIAIAFGSFFPIVIVYWASSKPGLKQFALSLLGAYFVCAVTWSPMTRWISAQSAVSVARASSLHVPSLSDVFGTTIGFFGIGSLWTLEPVGIAVVLTCAVAGQVVLALNRPSYGFYLFSFTFGYLLVCAALAMAVNPIFGRAAQRSLWINPLVLCLAAIAVNSSIRVLPVYIGGVFRKAKWLPQTGGAMAAMLIIGLSLRGLTNLQEMRPPMWSSVADVLPASLGERPVAVVAPGEWQWSLRFYVGDRFSEDSIFPASAESVPRSWEDLMNMIAEARELSEMLSGRPASRCMLFVANHHNIDQCAVDLLHQNAVYRSPDNQIIVLDIQPASKNQLGGE